MASVQVGVFVCACGHAKASHYPHGGRRVPLSGWVCRKAGCGCTEYGAGGVTVEFASSAAVGRPAGDDEVPPQK